MPGIWTAAIYAVLVVGMVVGMLSISAILGERHRGRAAQQPYEGGVWSIGGAWIRFAAPFTLVGTFFVLFDIEAAFLYAWAVAVRDLGWPGFMAVSSFAGILLIALVYLARNGALDTAPRRTTTEGD